MSILAKSVRACARVLRETWGYVDEPRLPYAIAMACLAPCDRVGQRPSLYGRPHIKNYGKMHIGHRFRLSSAGVQSHLVTGPRGELEIQHDVSIGHGAAIAAHAKVKIGQRVSIGPFVMIMDTDFHDAARHESGIPEGEPIVIGDAVRIGSRVTILKGTSIGMGARIQAGSVVSGVIPTGATVAGVPARIKLASRSSPLMHSTEAGVGIGERVQRVVADLFGLREPPPLASGPDQIEGWDSLGTLKLVLALEDEFGSVLDDSALLRCGNLRQLVTAIQASLH